MIIINTEKMVIKSWCNNPDENALGQARAIANLPFIFRQVCLMPDTHHGFSLPIGGVVACKNIVVPAFVGFDIGCGMTAVKTTFNAGQPREDTLKKTMQVIRRVVPMGLGCKHDEPKDLTDLLVTTCGVTHHAEKFLPQAEYQLGTLGSGNHFIELQLDEEGYLWIMLHSGSRKLGHNIADHYNTLAKKHHQEWHIDNPHKIYWLPANSEVGQDYITDMNYALAYAKLNREKMMYACMDAIKNCFKKYGGHRVGFEEMINIHHNYASIENHFKTNVWVHRKGATSAKKGELGIIPGSMGTASYIVKGLGNKESFNSCSHGAGRVLARGVAIKTLNLKEQVAKLDAAGVIHGIRNKDDLDESIGAYKDIDVVMEEQKDLVEIVTKLRPIASLKG